MKLNVIKLALYPITLIVIVVLAYSLISSVKKPIDETAIIARTEAAIIKKLEIIRDLQIAYQIQNSRYASKWEDLIDFAKNGSLYIINISETTELTATGQEKVSIRVDTIGTVPVADSLQRKYENNPNLPYQEKQEYAKILKDLDNLPYIPGAQGKKFELYANKIKKSGAEVDVFEVKDIFPMNPARGGTFDISQRKEIAVLVKEIEPKITQLKKNVKFYETKMQPFINKMAPFEEEYKKLETEDPIKNKAKMDELRAKMKPIEAKMEPFEQKWRANATKLELLEAKLKMYQELPLKVGSRDDVTTSGNWE